MERRTELLRGNRELLPNATEELLCEVSSDRLAV